MLKRVSEEWKTGEMTNDNIKTDNMRKSRKISTPAEIK